MRFLHDCQAIASGGSVDRCLNLRAGNEGSHLGLIDHWCGYTCKYSPALIEHPRRWVKHVRRKDSAGAESISRQHYEPALLTTLNERLKSGDFTVSHSRRWTNFEEHLLPRASWAEKWAEYYAALRLPLDADVYLAQLNENLTSVMAKVDRRVPQNSALTIDRDKGKFRLAALKGKERPDAVKVTKG